LSRYGGISQGAYIELSNFSYRFIFSEAKFLLKIHPC
jgi:hypothetical protein